ncbi:DsbA family protein [Ferrovibrio terrae]|uniref:DsbA family protein n=1 Tax=Ferrovibrio terrae TaxID=2594003 RepID=UPI0031380EBA
MKYIQRFVLTLVLVFGGFLAVGAQAQSGSAGADPRLQDMVLGKADAPITIIEYASLTCPHCASLHANVLPAIKTEYIDTGKVKLIYRDFPLDQLAFAGAVLARCGGPDKYFTYLNVLFAQQRQWSTAADPKAALVQIGRLGGVSAEQFDKCLADKPLGDYILNSRLEGTQKHNVSSTPTLIINGKTETGVPSLDELRKKLDALAKS